jgi:hypothetical protein
MAANRAIGRRVLLELWGEGKLEVANELYAPGYIDHVAGGPKPQRVSGPAGIKQAVTLFRTAFPDLTYSVEEEMAERDLCHDPLLGARHQSRTVSRSQADRTRRDLYRLRSQPHPARQDRRVLVNYDALALLQRLGIVPPVKGL